MFNSVKKTIASFGSWNSSIAAKHVARNWYDPVTQIRMSGENLYWLTTLTTQGGRRVIMHTNCATSMIKEITPKSYSVSSRVHEYGGGDYWVYKDIIFFVNSEDQRIYRQDEHDIFPITPIESDTSYRYADGSVDPRGEYIICVRESHKNKVILNELVKIDIKGEKEPIVLAKGSDFYASPRISHDGQKLTWICWNQPSMPWDHSYLWIADIKFDALENFHCIAGQVNESIYQPEWNSKNVLYFCSDRTGWWNIYYFENGEIHPTINDDVEMGAPLDLGTNRFIFLADENIACICTKNGIDNLAILDVKERKLTYLQLPWTTYANYLQVYDDQLFFIAHDYKTLPSLMSYHLKTTKSTCIYKHSKDSFDIKNISIPEALEFDSERGCQLYVMTTLEFKHIKEKYENSYFVVRDGIEDTFQLYYKHKYNDEPKLIKINQLDQFNIMLNNIIGENKCKYLTIEQIEELMTSNGGHIPETKHRCYAFFYPPTNANFQGPYHELPPLIVCSHPGPTSYSGMGLNLNIQFWTSRGFAVLDVNYSGSAGFGRRYRDALKNNYGIVDVIDCINATKFLISQKRVDSHRLFIKGASSGGYTALCAVAFHNIFQGAVSYFGISDLEALTKNNHQHKFEAHVLDSLVGPYIKNESLYQERSPIHYVDNIKVPILFLQGLKDQVVLPIQTKSMVEKLKKNHQPYEYITFENEYHGFFNADNIQRAIESEWLFYAKICQFKLSDELIDKNHVNFDLLNKNCELK